MSSTTASPAPDAAGDDPGATRRSGLAAVAAAKEALSNVASPIHATDAEILGFIKESEALINLIHSLQAGYIAAADYRELAQRHGARATHTWLQDVLNLNPAQALGRVTVARGITEPFTPDTGTSASMPLTKQALDEGVISVEHAKIIATCLEKLPADAADMAPDVEALLVEKAQECRPRDLRQLADGINLGYSRELGRKDERAQHEARDLYFITTDDGTLLIRARLDKVTGAKFLTALRPLSKPSPADGEPDSRTPGQRHADGLNAMLDIVLESDQMPRTGGERVQLVVGIDERDLRESADPDAPVVPGYLQATGEPITPEQVRRLACDSNVIRMLLGADGMPLSVGRTKRTAPTAIRIALFRRDGICAFPSCEQPPGTPEAHHIAHWADGGPTDLDNLVMLCSHHHTVMHSHEWEIVMCDNTPHFIPPAALDADRQPLPGGSAKPAAHQRAIRELIPRPRDRPHQQGT